MHVWIVLDYWGSDAPSVSCVFSARALAEAYVIKQYEQTDDYEQARAIITLSMNTR